jgi:hypothetical protein
MVFGISTRRVTYVTGNRTTVKASFVLVIGVGGARFLHIRSEKTARLSSISENIIY